jgi:arylsulfatase A-like enzyme
MFRAFFIGAGLAALLDATWAVRIAAVNGLRLEYFQWAMLGTLSVALVVGLGLRFVLGRPMFAGWNRRIQDGQAFWAGLVMGLMPLLSVYLPILEVRNIPMANLNRYVCFAIWMTPVLLVLRIAPKAPALLRQSSPLLTPLAAFFPILGLAAFGFGVIQGHQPPPRPQLPEAESVSQDLTGRPDLVLVSLDTLRNDLQRDGVDLMPLLTELKQEGMWPERAVSTGNQTVPGHIGMLSGLEQDQHLVNQNSEFRSTPAARMFAAKLLDHGYRTAGVISNAMVRSFGHGFEAFDDSRADYGDRFHFMRLASGSTWFAKVYGVRRATSMVEKWLKITGEDTLPPGMSAYTTDSALNYLDELKVDPNRPYHLFVHYMDPHSPYTPPTETAGRFAKEEDMPAGYRKILKDHRVMINHIRDDLQDDATRDQAKQAASHLRDLYDEEILYLDQEVRRLVDGIRQTGRPTLLIVTSDHGEYFGEHNLIEHSRDLYAEVMDVPFVMVGLNGFEVTQGEVPAVVSVVDVAPTFAAAAGVSLNRGTNDSLRGINLLAAGNDKFAERIHLMGWNTRVHGLYVAADNGEWKVIAKIEPNADSNELPTVMPLEVYHKAIDPAELNNLIADQPEGLEPLWGRLEEAAGSWFARGIFDPARRTQISAEDAAVMEALGYGERGTPPPPPKDGN